MLPRPPLQLTVQWWYQEIAQVKIRPPSCPPLLGLEIELWASKLVFIWHYRGLTSYAVYMLMLDFGWPVPPTTARGKPLD